jgi:hypothetical protein
MLRSRLQSGIAAAARTELRGASCVPSTGPRSSDRGCFGYAVEVTKVVCEMEC